MVTLQLTLAILDMSIYTISSTSQHLGRKFQKDSWSKNTRILMAWPGGCWFFNECLTYSASAFLLRHSFGFPFPINLFCIPLHGPSSPYSPSSDSLSNERWCWTWFDASVAFSLGLFSSDIVPYPFRNTQRAWQLFVFFLTKQVPYAFHVQVVRSTTVHTVEINLYQRNHHLEWGWLTRELT